MNILQENVFDVCNMTGIGYHELDKLPGKCATNYVWYNSTDDLRTNIFCVDAKGTAAGGAFITVKDVANFWKGLLDGKLLSKNMVANMLKSIAVKVMIRKKVIMVLEYGLLMVTEEKIFHIFRAVIRE